jgi:TatD DNase family protein
LLDSTVQTPKGQDKIPLKIPLRKKYQPDRVCPMTDGIPDMTGMYDSHFHLSLLAGKGLDPGEVMEGCFRAGFRGGVDIGTGIEDFERRLDAAAPYPPVFLSAGLYPSEAAGPWESKLHALEKQISHPRVVALGEAGLDFYRNYAPAKDQIALFSEQIELAAASRLPLVIHCRQAEDRMLEILRDKRPSEGGVRHCFSGDFRSAKEFADLGFRISFAGNLTYPKSEALRDAAVRLPLDLILLETDAPYLSPNPVRGLPCSPAYVAYTYAFLAKIRGLEIHTIVEAVEKNIKNCFPRMRACIGNFQEKEEGP